MVRLDGNVLAVSIKTPTPVVVKHAGNATHDNVPAGTFAVATGIEGGGRPCE
jgi:hypothetical protein